MATIPAQLPDLAGGQPSALGLLRRLEGGATLTGRVQLPTSTGATPVQIGNATLQLLLGQPIPPGTLVTVRSEGGRILVEPQPTPAQTAPPQGAASTATPSAPTPLASLIAANPALVQTLQLHELPVNLETLQILQTALGNVPVEQGPLLAFLLARNIPITAETLGFIRERLRARGNLGKELSTLLGEVLSLLSGGDFRGSEDLSSVLTQLQQILAWDPSGDLADRIKQLKDFFSTLEQKVLGGRADSAQTDFKGLLLKLDALLAQAGLGAEHPLRASAQKILALLEGAQLSGLAQLPTADSESWIFWRIPFPGDPSPTTIELALRGERDPENPERYDPKNLELLIQVDLSMLGPVQVRVRSSSENLRIAIAVSEREYYDSVRNDLPELLAALGEAGYDEVEAEVRVEAIAEDSLADRIDSLKDWRSPPDRSVSSSLDIRL